MHQFNVTEVILSKSQINIEGKIEDCGYLPEATDLTIQSKLSINWGQVRSAIERVRAAGVRVMMVTGDHPATARAIAIDVGIATSSKCHIITGSELRNMTPNLLSWALKKHYEIGR